MLLSPEMLITVGPPPQAVLDRRWLWNILSVLLAATFFTRLVGLDIAGALLSGLLLCFVVIMLRDGMQELSKYALVYAVLCGLNLFFDMLPLITEIGGRVTRTSHPVVSSSDGKGFRETTYTLTTRVTPFFAAGEGVIYNAQSASMLLSPICMALGVYLSLSAHKEIQSQAPSLFSEDLEDIRRVMLRPQAMPPVGQVGPRSRVGPGVGGIGQQPSRPGMSGVLAGGTSGREPFESFSGTPHKL